MGNVKVILFFNYSNICTDKTGTLTYGEMQLNAVLCRWYFHMMENLA